MLHATGTTDRFIRRWGWSLIALAVLVVYWPLSTFHYTVADGDTFDCFVPWRWFITCALKDGHMPLWDPLQQMGYPFYADLASSTWDISTIAIGGTIGHSIFTLQWLYLLHVILGGIGMMRLTRTLHGHEGAALITGLAYSLCGFFTAHQMNLHSVTSAAILPWLLAAQLKLMRDPHWRHALEAALFQALQLMGGNQTFTILSSYLLIALFITHIARKVMSGEGRFARAILLYEFLFMAATALMAIGILYAWWEERPFIDRVHGVTYAYASKGPFTFKAAISLLFPFVAGHEEQAVGTDPTMANGYVGVLIMMLAMLSLGRRRRLEENVIMMFGIICACAAFGAALPVHHVLWRIVPGINLFRFPSYFGLYATLAALVLAGGTLADGRWKSPPFSRHAPDRLRPPQPVRDRVLRHPDALKRLSVQTSPVGGAA